jgi:putative DNA primase/helicase
MNKADRFAIPGDLRSRHQWLVWRRERRSGKETKVPYRAKAPNRLASTTDPKTWSSFEQAHLAFAAGRADGLGFVFAETDPFCGIDLDDCRDPETGGLNEKAVAIVAALDSYTEASVSGGGVHVIVRAKLAGTRNRKGPVELYDRGRYLAMTGELLVGLPHSPMPRQAELDQLCVRLFPPPRSAVQVTFRPSVPADDRELLERAFSAKNGTEFSRLWNGDTSKYDSRSEADLALCSHLAYWTGGDPAWIDSLFRRSRLMRDKWLRDDYRERTITKATGG